MEIFFLSILIHKKGLRLSILLESLYYILPIIIVIITNDVDVYINFFLNCYYISCQIIDVIILIIYLSN